VGEGQNTGPGSEDDESEVKPAATRAGSVVGKYAIVRLLGQGGMGAVYEARHSELSRRFAVKFLLPEFTSHREVLARFESEAKAAGGLEHPNLVAVTDVGRAVDGAPYLVMEFLQGEDCAHLLRRLGPLPVVRAADIVLQVCRGLAVAHKAGIVHRDLKPENLFVTDAGDGSDRVKVLDFGIAQIRSPDRSRLTRTGATMGTANYMSPEQAHGAGDIDSRTDVWSLGVVLYELLSGRKPFEGERFLQVIHQVLDTTPPPLASLRAGLPPNLIALVERAMAKNVAERLPSVAALADGLAPFAGRAPSPPIRDVSALAPTQPTPATVLPRALIEPAKTTGLTSAKSHASEAASPTRRTPIRWAVASLGAAVVVATGAFVARSGTGAHPTAEAGPAQMTAQGEVKPAVRVAASAAPVTAPPPALSVAPRGDEAGAQALSELSEQGPDKSVRPAPRPRTPSRPPTLAPAAAPTPAPTAPPQSAKGSEVTPPEATHPTKIDRANPY
jgi:eukaryotic-like serine/threonine-protein kinase